MHWAPRYPLPTGKLLGCRVWPREGCEGRVHLVHAVPQPLQDPVARAVGAHCGEGQAPRAHHLHQYEYEASLNADLDAGEAQIRIEAAYIINWTTPVRPSRCLQSAHASTHQAVSHMLAAIRQPAHPAAAARPGCLCPSCCWASCACGIRSLLDSVCFVCPRLL